MIIIKVEQEYENKVRTINHDRPQGYGWDFKSSFDGKSGAESKLIPFKEEWIDANLNGDHLPFQGGGYFSENLDMQAFRNSVIGDVSTVIKSIGVNFKVGLGNGKLE